MINPQFFFHFSWIVRSGLSERVTNNLPTFIMSQSADSSAPTKDNPYQSKLLVNRLLTEGSDKETRHFELSLEGSSLSYEPGDSLG